MESTLVFLLKSLTQLHLTQLSLTNAYVLLLQISGTGLGALEKNAESIFFSLTNATQNPQTINTFPNLNASVQVISTMSIILTDHGVNDTTTSNVSTKEYLSYYYLKTFKTLRSISINTCI